MHYLVAFYGGAHYIYSVIKINKQNQKSSKEMYELLLEAYRVMNGNNRPPKYMELTCNKIRSFLRGYEQDKSREIEKIWRKETQVNNLLIR